MKLVVFAHVAGFCMVVPCPPQQRCVANSIVSLDRVSKRKRSCRYTGHRGIFQYHDEFPQALEFLGR